MQNETKQAPKTVDEYIAAAPAEVRPRLEAMRALIRETAPQAREKISWGMATYDLNGNLVHFAAQKHHMGFYPGASGVAHFQAKLTGYKTSKGAIQLPYNQELPVELIKEIIRFRVKEQQGETE